MMNGEQRPLVPSAESVRERIRTVQVAVGSYGERRGNADFWLVLFVIDCINNSGTDQKNFVAPEKTNFLAWSVQFPLSNPYLYR